METTEIKNELVNRLKNSLQNNSVLDNLRLLAKEFPNDMEFGGLIRQITQDQATV